MKRILYSLVFSLLLLIVSPCWAANHYIRPSFSGTHDGNSWTTAYSGFPGSYTRGDTYYVATGSYGSITFPQTSGTSYITIKKATASDHGTDTGWDSSYGTGQATFTGVTFSSGAAYYIFDGAVGGGPGSWNSGHGFKVDASSSGKQCVISLGGADHIQILHTESVGSIPTVVCDQACWGDRDTGSGMTNILISHSYCHNAWVPIFDYGSKGFTVEYSMVENNGPQNINSDGCGSPDHIMHREMWSTWGATNMTFRYNYVHNIYGTGIIANMNGGGVSGADIYGNVFYSDNNGGSGSNHWPTSDGNSATKNGLAPQANWKVFNNTFVHTMAGVTTITLEGNTCTGTCFSKNNLMYQNYGIYISASDVPQSHSWAHGNANWYSGSGNSTDSQVSGETGAQFGTGNPFMNSSGGDFRLTAHTNAGSAVTGTPVSPFNTGGGFNIDAYGNTRTNWDRGAYEYSDGAVAGASNLHIDQVQP